VERAVTVAIVEDHPVVIEGVTSWINADPQQRIQVIQVTPDVTGLASADPGADVIILDLELSGRMITHEIPGLVAAGRRIVAFSAHTDPAIILAVLDAGAHAYVTKDEGRDCLVDAVLAAAGDRPYVTRSQAKAILADSRPRRPALSAQERQALLLWFQGMSKASVARRMSISEHTVRQYINRARVKYASAGRPAPSKDALLARAIEDGIIQPGEVAIYTSHASSHPSVPPG
jgi:two-component system nitrate/nitrite response regulator NarL